jgi:hypothetical protein
MANDRYRLRHVHEGQRRDGNMMKTTTEGILDVTKIAVVGSVGMGLAGMAGNMLHK